MATGVSFLQSKARLLMLSTSLAAIFSGVCAAEGAESMPQLSNGWSLQFKAYSWLPWLSGDAKVKGRSLDVDVGPRQIIENLDWSTLPIWMSYAEIQNGRLFFFNDIVYSKVEGSAGFASTASGALASLALAGDVQASYEQATIEFGAGYAVVTQGSTRLDAIAGARYWRQELDISADLAATLAIAGPGGIVDLETSGGRVIARSGSVDWLDPFIGFRVQHDINPTQRLTFRGDIGGFGAGSDLSWQLIGTFDWQMCRTDSYVVDAYAGYRALSVDYSEGSGANRYEYDVLQQGPIMGLTVRY